MLIHYNLAPSGLVTMESINAKFTRLKIRFWCVVIIICESGLCKVLQSYSVQSATIIDTSLQAG